MLATGRSNPLRLPYPLQMCGSPPDPVRVDTGVEKDGILGETVSLHLEFGW